MPDNHRYFPGSRFGSNTVSPEFTAPAAPLSLHFLLAPCEIIQPIMSVALNSDQVVEDYKSSLLDLTQNNKHEINLLTVIASEYIGKAVELSRVLETHIRNVGFIERRRRALLPCFPLYMSPSDRSIGTSRPKITRFLCLGFDRKECRWRLHSLPWPELIPHLHERVCIGASSDPKEAG